MVFSSSSSFTTSMEWSECTFVDGGVCPTIKNHSVTYYNNFLYCFGGYDGRRNHMTLLLYDLKERRWIRPECNSIGETGSGMGPHVGFPDHHNNGHNNNNGNDDDDSNRSSSPFVVVQGTPPPGRNGHSATLAEDYDGGSARIIIIGGWLGMGPLAASDMHILDISRSNPSGASAATNNTNANNHHHGSSSSNNNNNHHHHHPHHNSTSHQNQETQYLRWYQPQIRGTAPGPCNMHSADYVPSTTEVYVFRGGNGREYLNDLHALHVDTLTWRRVDTVGTVPQQRANHSSAMMEETNELFIFGGWNGTERLNDIHVLDIATSTWTFPAVGGLKPHPRAGMTLTALRGRLFLFGGSGTSAKCFQDLQILDRNEMAWLDVSQQEQQQHQHARGSSSHSGSAGAAAAANRALSYHHHHQDAQQQAPNPNDDYAIPSVVVHGVGPRRRAGHTATAVHSRIFVFGGSCGSDYLNDFYVLDTDPTPHAVVTEPTTTQSLEQRLRHYMNDEEFADVVFVVQGQRVYAHKMILSIVSDCFRAMFTTGFREAEATEIVLPDCTYRGFVCVMEYIYSGVMPNNTNTDVLVEMLELADRFLLVHLKQTCESRLRPDGVESAEYLLSVAQKTNANQLLAACEHYLRNRDNPQQNEQQQRRGQAL